MSPAVCRVSVRHRPLAIVGLMTAMLLPPWALQAQSIKFSSSQATLVGTAFKYPSSMVMAPNGDLYVADMALDYIVKIPAGGGAWVRIGSGFNQPRGVALDKAGNVYVADTVNHRVMKVAAADGSQKQLCGGVVWGSDIVVDDNGN